MSDGCKCSVALPSAAQIPQLDLRDHFAAEKESKRGGKEGKGKIGKRQKDGRKYPPPDIYLSLRPSYKRPFR